MPHSFSLALTVPETLLLDCICAGSSLSESVIREVGQAWPEFWALAAEQDVQPLIAHILAADPASDLLPEQARFDLKAVRVETTVRNLALDSERLQIEALLARNGVPSIPLKGTQLQARLFAGFGARMCGDIDILVRKDDWGRAHRLLLEFGYRPIADASPGVRRHAFHGIPLKRVVDGNVFVAEVHHQLSDPRHVSIDHDALWRRVDAESAGDGTNRRLPTEELLLFLALHLPKHDRGLLRLIADIDYLIAVEGHRIDWSYLFDLATRWRANTILYFAIESTTTLLQTSWPASIRDGLQPSSWKRALVSLLAGPWTILRPPASHHARTNRFRIAYCLMLTPGKTMLHSYWTYIIAGPVIGSNWFPNRVIRSASHPFRAIVRTMMALASAVHDACRFRLGVRHISH